MPNFVLQIILLVSFAVMVFLVARAAPRIGDTLPDERRGGRAGLGKKFYNLVESLPLQKIDLAATKFLEKVLRRTRVLIIKLDNKLVSHLERFKLMRKSSVEQQKKEFVLFKENGDDAASAETPADVIEDDLAEFKAAGEEEKREEEGEKLEKRD